MIVMFKMTPEKREKFSKKIDKMMDFLDEFKECLEDSEDMDEEDYEEPQYRNSMMRRGSSSAMKTRYSRRGGM